MKTITTKLLVTGLILAVLGLALLFVSSTTHAQTPDNNHVYLPIIMSPCLPGSLCNGDFEFGHAFWAEFSQLGYDLITNSPMKLPHGGSWAAWLGGANNEVSIIQQQVTVPVSAPFLWYWHWIDLDENFCGIDVASISVNGNVVDAYDLCIATDTGKWVRHGVDLSSFAGQTVSIQIMVVTDDTLISHLFIDDVTFKSTSAHLALVKNVINDNGGTALVTDFTLTASGPSPISGAGTVESDVIAGTYTLSELGVEGYTASSWICTAGELRGNQISLSVGDSATCMVTNNDQPAQITLTKIVVNDDSGTRQVPDFPLYIGGIFRVSGVTYIINAGNYTASETQKPGYTASGWGGDCASDGTISLTPGQNATCTITNNDDPPSHLTLIKSVINDDGGTAVAADFVLSASGPSMISGAGGIISDVIAGIYTLSETGPWNYTAGNWECSGGILEGNLITLGQGESAVCTITNNDLPPPVSVCNGDFEAGPSCWTEYSSYEYWSIISDSLPVNAHGGSWAAYLGGYDNTFAYIEQNLTVPLQTPYFAYWQLLGSNDMYGNDFARIRINGTLVDEYDLYQPEVNGQWVQHIIDLRNFAGEEVLVQISMETDPNYGSQFLIDDVTFQASSIPFPSLIGGLHSATPFDNNNL